MHILVSKPCKSYIFLMWDQSGQSQAEKLALKGSLKEHRICSMSPTLRANCLINIIHVHLMISCLSLKNLPAYLDLMWLWENRSWLQCKKKLSTLKNFLHIYKGWSCFVPDTQSSKGINKTQNLLKLRTFLLRLSAWRGSFSWWLRINLHSLVFICWWCTTWCDG